MAKHIFVTGGVVSSLGKGLTAAAIGLLLERRGLRVQMQKLDPYLNVDPGTMNPFEHGEVYVLDDGAETDLDLGHYERFTNAKLNRRCAITAGQVYQAIIEKERKGDFLGKTVQVIPHVVDEIKARIATLAEPGIDVVVTEIGGTVGDIEALPFLEAIRQFALDVGREECLYVHLTLVPYLKAAGEAKTKPSQHSVQLLRTIGIQPDILVCRTERDLADEDRRKIALFCNVPLAAVIEEQDKKVSIYEVPPSLHRNGIDQLACKKLGIVADAAGLGDWAELLDGIANPRSVTSIAVVGKYVKHRDAYKSVYEALLHAGAALRTKVLVTPIEAEAFESGSAAELLAGTDGVLVPGGFGHRGVEGKLQAIEHARTRGIPFFGICLGLQCAAIEFARNVLGLADANSTEFAEGTADPVIALMPEQHQHLHRKGGTMRLGAQPCGVAPGTLAAAAYGQAAVSERHRHRFEFNGDYLDRFQAAGLRASGVHPQTGLVEILELANHPWFLAVQFHPEFQSKLTAPHPLFKAFVEAARKRRAAAG